jgi:hypothetical protein
LFYGYLVSGFDFHSVLEHYPDIIFAVNRDVINEALELYRVELLSRGLSGSAKRSSETAG